MKTFRLVLWVGLLFLLWTPLVQGAETVQVFPLQHRGAAEVLPLVRDMVGNAGTVSSIDNKLVVKGSQETLQQVAQLLAQVDIPKTVLQIIVRQSVNRSGQHIQTSADPSASRRLSTSDDEIEQSMLVNDGDTATLEIGRDVPFTSSMAAFTGEDTGYSQTRTIRRVSTGFTIHPELRGDKVQLQVIPQLQALDDGPEGPIHFQELMTNVLVPLDTWYNLAGQLDNHDEVSREVLRLSTGDRYQSRDIWIKIHKLAE